MQAYKLNATIDEPLNIAPGKVEVIILQSEPSVETSTETQPQPAKPKRIVECSIPILKEWLESTEPTPSDFLLNTLTAWKNLSV